MRSIKIGKALGKGLSKGNVRYTTHTRTASSIIRAAKKSSKWS